MAHYSTVSLTSVCPGNAGDAPLPTTTTPGTFFSERFADATLDSKISRAGTEACWIAGRVPRKRILDLAVAAAAL